MPETSGICIRILPGVTTASERLLGTPVSSRLHSGYVCLLPGEAGQQHSTEAYEEQIVVLEGEGELRAGSETHLLDRDRIAYIPPQTPHFVKNCGEGPLRYIYIVARVLDAPEAS